MTPADADTQSTGLSRAAAALNLYREDLLRAVAAKLIRPRSQYDVEDLRERMVAALDDPVGLDRTLKHVSPVARRLLRLIDLSRQLRWSVQSLASVLPVLGHNEGLGPVIELLETGLLFPELPAGLPIESFEAWLAQASFDPIALFAVPLPAARCRAEPFAMAIPAGNKARLTPIEADGLEWLLRSAVVWQLALAAPVRKTQTGGLFKRDQERLRGHALLSASLADSPIALIDPALLTLELARGIGIIKAQSDEWLAGTLPTEWATGLAPPLAQLWSALNETLAWDPLRGYEPDLLTRKWLPALGVGLAAVLIDTPTGVWQDVNDLACWLTDRQPDVAREIADLSAWCANLLVGVWHPLRIVEIAKGSGSWCVRLSGFGRMLLSGDELSLPAPPITQTLLVQPNLEVLVYRQGLTPSLIAKLTQMAQWKTLGLACTLTLTPESVYRGLESGLSLNDVQRTLERHSTRPLSETVIDSLRSWASKRERVQVYPTAVLLEFRTAADLDGAMQQGLVEQKLTERIGLIADEKAVDYSRLRLVGSRDYLSPEERCIDIGDDGLTLIVADGKADLLLSAEARRFADPADPGADERSRWRMSVASLRRAKESGIDLRWLEEWFQRRHGFNVPATAKLLFLGSAVGPFSAETTTILRVPSSDVADGLERWPATRRYLVERLGPTVFAVKTDQLRELLQLLAESGINVAG